MIFICICIAVLGTWMKRKRHVCIDKEAKWTHLSCSLLTQTNLNIKIFSQIQKQNHLKIFESRNRLVDGFVMLQPEYLDIFKHSNMAEGWLAGHRILWTLDTVDTVRPSHGSTWCYKYPKYLSVLVCEDMVDHHWWYQKYQVSDYLSTCQSKRIKKEDDHLSVLVCEDMVVPGVGADQAAKISKTFCLKSALWSGWWWQWNNYVWQWYQIEIILILDIFNQQAQKHLDGHYQKWKHLGRSEESRMLNCGSVTFPRLFSFKLLHYIQDNLVIMTVIIELISDKDPRMWGFKPQVIITCIAKSPFVCTWIWLPSAQ